LPFSIIGVIGIILIITLSSIGIHNADQAKKDKEQAAMDPEAIFKQNCSSCHGQNLEGGAGPSLAKVGGKYDKAQIAEILRNGKGSGMPAGVVKGEEANIIAQWLSEKK
jgi:mono/diheme cytochrome c family protein